MPRVISGQELKDVRARSGLGNAQLAEILDESLSTVNRWLANGVRPEKEAKVRERLAVWLPQTEPDRYTHMSDAALLAEMTRLLGIIGQRLADREVPSPVSDTASGAEGHDKVSDSPDDATSSTESGNNTESLAAAGEADSDNDPNKIGPRTIRGRGPGPRA